MVAELKTSSNLRFKPAFLSITWKTQMPLYELIGIVRPGKIAEVRDIARSSSTLILNAGGVIRGITNWGTFLLPRPQRRHNTVFNSGHHFILRFDSSSRAQHAMRRTLGLDPRIIRYSIVKLGSTLDQIKDVSGTVGWNNKAAMSAGKRHD